MAVADCTSSIQRHEMTSDTLVRLPEEEEYARLRRRLEELEDELAEREVMLATLRRELSDFLARYLGLVGTRLSRLDRLEAELAAILARTSPSAESERRAEQASARAAESTRALGDDPDALADAASEQPREIPEDLKRLYREVAKAVHPDLAANDEDRQLRERLMAEANRAYADGDASRLRRILEGWERHPAAVGGEDIGSQLVRVIRAMAAVEARLAAIDEEEQAMKSQNLYALMVRCAQAQGEGRDLLREMASEVEDQIEEALERLRAAQEAAGRPQ
jgi:hypothetical protein